MIHSVNIRVFPEIASNFVAVQQKIALSRCNTLEFSDFMRIFSRALAYLQHFRFEITMAIVVNNIVFKGF